MAGPRLFRSATVQLKLLLFVVFQFSLLGACVPEPSISLPYTVRVSYGLLRDERLLFVVPRIFAPRRLGGRSSAPEPRTCSAVLPSTSSAVPPMLIEVIEL